MVDDSHQPETNSAADGEQKKALRLRSVDWWSWPVPALENSAVPNNGSSPLGERERRGIPVIESQ